MGDFTVKQELLDELEQLFKSYPKKQAFLLTSNKTVKAISGFDDLINTLRDLKSSPKQVALQVEAVIINITMKQAAATELEQSLKKLLEEYQDKLRNGNVPFHELKYPSS